MAVVSNSTTDMESLRPDATRVRINWTIASYTLPSLFGCFCENFTSVGLQSAVPMDEDRTHGWRSIDDKDYMVHHVLGVVTGEVVPIISDIACSRNLSFRFWDWCMPQNLWTTRNLLLSRAGWRGTHSRTDMITWGALVIAQSKLLLVFLTARVFKMYVLPKGSMSEFIFWGIKIRSIFASLMSCTWIDTNFTTY